jgi:hypothetical protein
MPRDIFPGPCKEIGHARIRTNRVNFVPTKPNLRSIIFATKLGHILSHLTIPPQFPSPPLSTARRISRRIRNKHLLKPPNTPLPRLRIQRYIRPHRLSPLQRTALYFPACDVALQMVCASFDCEIREADFVWVACRDGRGTCGVWLALSIPRRDGD